MVQGLATRQHGSCSGQPRGSSVFPAPCRAAVHAATYEEASAVNRQKTGRGLSQQAWGIAPKIKQVDDAITSECQRWAFEVHPEVCFWALNQRRPMAHNKKTQEGVQKGSPCCVECSQKLKPTSQTDPHVSERTICWTRR